MLDFLSISIQNGSNKKQTNDTWKDFNRIYFLHAYSHALISFFFLCVQYLYFFFISRKTSWSLINEMSNYFRFIHIKSKSRRKYETDNAKITFKWNTKRRKKKKINRYKCIRILNAKSFFDHNFLLGIMVYFSAGNFIINLILTSVCVCIVYSLRYFSHAHENTIFVFFFPRTEYVRNAKMILTNEKYRVALQCQSHFHLKT